MREYILNGGHAILGFYFPISLALRPKVLLYNERILRGEKWVWDFLNHKWQKFIWNHELKRVPLEDKWFAIFLLYFKGQIKPKADWRAIDFSKKRTGEIVLFAFLLFTANKSNSSVRFLGESTARQSAFRFYLTFTKL